MKHEDQHSGSGKARHVVIRCGTCRSAMSSPLLEISHADWFRWAKLWRELGDRANEFDVMPLVPLGGIVRFEEAGGSPDWGGHPIHSTDPKWARRPEGCFFLAPNELDKEAGPTPYGCCGPVDDLRSEEHLACSCGNRIGWREDDCSSHVSYDRIHPGRVTLEQELGPLWPPVDMADDFDENIFALAISSDAMWEPAISKSRTAHVRHFWKIYEMYGEGSVIADAVGSRYWTYYPKGDVVKIRDGCAPAEFEEMSAPGRTVAATDFWHCIRLAMQVLMGTIPRPPNYTYRNYDVCDGYPFVA